MRKGFRPGKSPEEIKEKEARKEFEKKQKDFEARMDEFQKEFAALSRKYKVGPGAVLDRKPNKTEAFPVWLDEKPMYEAKEKQEAEKESQDKPKGLIV